MTEPVFDQDRLDAESHRYEKQQLRRIVSMLTKLIARPESVAEPAAHYQADVDYEYEYRFAEHEHEHEHEHEGRAEPEPARPPEPGLPPLADREASGGTLCLHSSVSKRGA